jgi:cellulose synthase (UDP-forming)
MTDSSVSNRKQSVLATRVQRQPPVATWVLLGLLALSITVIAAWWSNHDGLSTLFHTLAYLQERPPLGLESLPETPRTLLAPTLGLWFVVLGVMTFSPFPKPWSRRIIVSILLVLTLRYLLWRSLSTLNLTTPLNGTFSLLLLGMEGGMILANLIQLVLLFTVRDRQREADRASQAVLAGHFTPWVDVLIPTYNEPVFILRRTVMGCQAMDYPRKTVYLLDDTRRPAVHALAQELGCEYLTRPDNRFAKAGNLNHGLAHSRGDLIAVFDADFVPTTNFLTRTVGFFQRPQVGLVQTPQSFYNPDPIAHNLGLAQVLPPEEEVFYRHIQPMRDGVGGVICSGTSFVVRRQALEQVGGFVTESLSEDYFTGIRIGAAGYQLLYLDEKLSAGLAAENMAAHALQRMRWGRGTLQAFFIKANPLTLPGLSWMQRLAHLEGILNWFMVLSRVVLLWMPLSYAFLGVIPLRTTGAELVYFFLPYYWIQLWVFAWLNRRSRSAILSDLYSVILCFPLAVVVVQTLLRPFAAGFRVTPKGTSRHKSHFNWMLAWPLILTWGATAVSLGLVLSGQVNPLGFGASETGVIASSVFGIGWVWNSYNLVILTLALLVLWDMPRQGETLTGQWPVRIWLSASPADAQAEPRSLWGLATQLSETGATLRLAAQAHSEAPIAHATSLQVEFLDTNLTLPAAVRQHQIGIPESVLSVQFTDLSLAQQRQLVHLLFGRPGQWPSRQTPNEVRSILLVLKALIQRRVSGWDCEKTEAGVVLQPETRGFRHK